MAKSNVRIRGVYGKPWSKIAGDITLSREVLEELGRVLVESIVREARVDFAKQGRTATPRGQPEGLPQSKSFFDSFSFRIRGRRTIEIMSTWPVIRQITEGRGQYRMTWLTKESGIGRIPIPQPNGTILIRSTPTGRGDAWIHPGFARHTFLERGVRKGRREMARIVLADVKRQLLKGDPTR